jgi:hypothetical protein
VAFDEVAALGLGPDHPTVRQMVELGLMEEDAERLRTTPAGRRVLDAVTTELALAHTYPDTGSQISKPPSPDTGSKASG